MKIQAAITRRSMVAAAAVLLLTGCSADANAGSAPAVPAEPAVAEAWDAKLDADAPILNVEGEEGAVMPGECWTVLEDGTIQLQVAGSSTPEPEVESVDFADGVVTVTMATPEEGTPATMDFVLHQFMVTPAEGVEVTGVVLVRGEERVELPAGVVVEDAE